MSYKALFFIFFQLCFFSLAENAEVTNLSQEQYFSAVTSYLNQGKNKVRIALSHFYCKTKNSSDPLFQVLEKINEINEKGVDVKIFLNSWFYMKPGIVVKNYGLEYLKDHNIPIETFSDTGRINSQTIIIDDEIVIFGNQPWVSDLDYENNYYSNTIIQSSSFAKEKVDELNKVFKEKYFYDGDFIKLPESFFTKRILKKLLGEHPRFFSFFLMLLFKDFKEEDKWFHFSYTLTGQRFFSDLKSKEDVKKQSLKFLKKLSRWRLIELNDFQSGHVSVKICPLEKGYGWIKIPLNYFRFQYEERLTRDEKFIYFTLLRNGSKNDGFKVVRDEELLFIFGKKASLEVESVLVSLEKMLLIDREVFPDGTEGYQILSPLNYSEYQKTLELFIQQYGAKDVQKAQILASQLNKEHDVNIISEVIYFIKELGFLETQKIFHSVVERPFSDPLRNYSQVKKMCIGMIYQRVNK